MKAKLKPLMSSEKQDWGTPQVFFDKCNKLFGPFDMDVAADSKNTKCDIFFALEEGDMPACDGLSEPWVFYRKTPVCWMNPPYKTIALWMKKAYEESLKGAKVCCLVPARTDTRWFHDYCTKGQIIFLKGRLKFEGAEASAPFPSMLVLFGYGEPSVTIGLPNE